MIVAYLTTWTLKLPVVPDPTADSGGVKSVVIDVGDTLSVNSSLRTYKVHRQPEEHGKAH